MINLDILNLILTNASEEQVFNWRFLGEHAFNFFLLLGLLYFLLKDKVKNFLVERRGMIGNEIDQAQKTIAEAKEKYEEYAQRLNGIEAEINSIKETLHNEAEHEREGILRQARHTSEVIAREAKETIEFETERAKREIRTEVVDQALRIAEELIKKNFGESDKERLIENFTKNIGDEKWHQSQH